MSIASRVLSDTTETLRMKKYGLNRIQTIPLHRIPPGQQEAFRSSCRRWQKQTDEFLVEAQKYDPRSSAPSLGRAVIVVHYPSTKGKRYDAGLASDWNAAFERDLEAVYYPSGTQHVSLEIECERKRRVPSK
ncbi:MAG: hypothetical protein ACJ8R9_25590 [Steroidobacteraceae bacterium]